MTNEVVSDVNVFGTCMEFPILHKCNGRLVVTEQYCGIFNRFEEFTDEWMKSDGFLDSVGLARIRLKWKCGPAAQDLEDNLHKLRKTKATILLYATVVVLLWHFLAWTSNTPNTLAVVLLSCCPTAGATWPCKPLCSIYPPHKMQTSWFAHTPFTLFHFQCHHSPHSLWSPHSLPVCPLVPLCPSLSHPRWLPGWCLTMV